MQSQATPDLIGVGIDVHEVGVPDVQQFEKVNGGRGEREFPSGTVGGTCQDDDTLNVPVGAGRIRRHPPGLPAPSTAWPIQQSATVPCLIGTMTPDAPGASTMSYIPEIFGRRRLEPSHPAGSWQAWCGELPTPTVPHLDGPTLSGAAPRRRGGKRQGHVLACPGTAQVCRT